MRKQTLRSQFLVRVLITLLMIVSISGVIQMYSVREQLNENVTNQANIMAKSILQGIKEKEVASRAIEYQIDLKLVAYAKHVADRLKGKTVSQITNEELVRIRDELKLSGITILTRVKDDIVGVRSTEPEEIGFSFKKIGYPDGFTAMDNLLNGRRVNVGETYQDKNLFILPISQSGSHAASPTFFKYGYYRPEGSTFIIAPYVEANEVYQFTKQVGPDQWIHEVIASNPFVKEIGVVNPQVYKDPSLAGKLYPPLKKLEYGSFAYETEKDEAVLTQMAAVSELTQFVQEVNGRKLYKMFMPIDKNRVIYIAFDYDKMSEPIYRNSVILIVSGLISLLALFLLTSRFFNGIYHNIQRIKSQVKLLEAGDFTARSEVKDRSELGELSESTNHMAETLQQVLRDTSEQAQKAQKLSVILQTEANQIVEKMYVISMEATSYSRSKLDDIMEFLDCVEGEFKALPQTEKTEELLRLIDVMRGVARDRTAATTDMTIELSDLIKSLRDQSNEMSGISSSLFHNISKFKL
jgi:methyl-accepting chemotaxis protein